MVNKIDERHKLELVQLDKEPVVEFNFKEMNKNIKKTNEQHGKVIRVGAVTFKSNFECGNINNVRLTAHNTYQIDLQR